MRGLAGGRLSRRDYTVVRDLGCRSCARSSGALWMARHL